MRAIFLVFLVFVVGLAPMSACAGRVRPALNGITLATEIDTPLRGTHWATDVTSRVPTIQELRRIRETGGNALHLYGENFSSGTPVGTKMALIDTIVQITPARISGVDAWGRKERDRGGSVGSFERVEYMRRYRAERESAAAIDRAR